MSYWGTDHWTQGDLSSQIPQVSPKASRMQPFSPQLLLQLFLILQYSEVMPTSMMSWFRSFLQLLNTPDEQRLQLVASADTPTGWLRIALARASHPFTMTTELILKSPPSMLQFLPVLAVQGQAASVAIPWSLTQARPSQLKPPLQPSLPYFFEQSTSCCSDRLTVFPLNRAQDSSTPVALKAQQDPQLPWFLIGETLPWVVQSTSPLKATASSCDSLVCSTRRGSRQVLSNSWSVRPVNWLTPMVQLWVLSALWAWMSSMLRRKMMLRQWSSAGRQLTPNCCFHCWKASSGWGC